MIFGFVQSAQRQAASLRISLIGQRLINCSISNDVSILPQVGRIVEEVRAYSREIEIVFDDGVVLRTKMRINGSWKISQANQSVGRAQNHSQVVLMVDDKVARCVGASEVETHHDFDPRRHPILGRHGPDLSDPATDLDHCADRMLAYEDADATVAEVLLDQRVMRGIGNVFRCELLWSCELHPWAKISSLSREECRELVTIAAEMLQSGRPQSNANLVVYGRHGKTCQRCNGQVRVTHHGEANRVLYWCADCQTRHAGTSSSRYVTEHDTPPGVHPAEFIYLSELDQTRKSG